MTTSRQLGGCRGRGHALHSPRHSAARGRRVSDGVRWRHIEQSSVATDAHHAGQGGQSGWRWCSSWRARRVDQPTAIAKDRWAVVQHPGRWTGPVGGGRGLGGTDALIVSLQILVGAWTGISEHASGSKHTAALLVGASIKD